MIKRTILIVDDQLINRKILGALLEKEYEMLYAQDGKAAMDIMKQHSEKISAVLLDIVMPVMDGFAVLEAMEKDKNLSKIPVIVSSQMEGDEAELHALSLGAQDFIAKPYKGDIIRHRLGNMIRLRETASIINKIEKDELTGLYNKQFFLQKVSELLQRTKSQIYDIVCFGIERFKLINDTYGMAKGDEVLHYFATQLKHFCHLTNVFGRFSSDEFYGLLPHKEKYENEEFLQFFRQVNQFPIDMDIKIHCGIYVINDKSVSVNAMCDRAKLAADKNRGKYDVAFSYYDDSIRKKLLEEQFIINTMQRALEEEQFQVYYQPKYDLSSEMIAGAEALVRWIHPEKGFLSPGSFIPLFERNGFITSLDRYVWERVCKDIREWMDQGYSPVSVSVNVSRADIYNPKLTDVFLDLIAKYSIPMHLLHLEVTESAYTDNPEQIISVVNRLRDLGFIIEMDDFGSGYSSLNMLAEMPVDVLKLDMKFIQNESKKVSGKGILSFVISLAKWLNLAVVAEGVETAEQIASLRSMDCNYVQGFYYAKPMKKESFEDLIKHSYTTEMVCSSRTAEQYITENEKEISVMKQGQQMLIVDDIDVNRSVLACAFLEEYVIVEKSNGKEAWEYLQENYQKVDIVMLDLLMPVMDGFQLLEKIRNDEKMKNIPVIITSQGDGNSEQSALEMKADDFISKPYKPDIIKHRVHNVIDSYRLKKILENQSKQTSALEKNANKQLAYQYIEQLKPHFDLVRLVDPRNTTVYREDDVYACDLQACYSVWGKTGRCNHCISLRALQDKTRYHKLEYSKNALYFVIAEYVPFREHGAVIEMVTKMDDDYVDNIFDKDLLYVKLDEIHQKLEYDELTGVYNRRHIDRYLNTYIENARKRKKDLGIAMIDIDYFKKLNDTHGHLTGDIVLKNVAKMLEMNIARSKGDFVARFGGDEFMIVCRNISPEIFYKRISAVTQLVKHIAIESGEKIEVGISAGCVNVSEFPNYSLEEFVKCADERLYRAKKEGRGCVMFSDCP